jgi:hypothetical protein
MLSAWAAFVMLSVAQSKHLCRFFVRRQKLVYR